MNKVLNVTRALIGAMIALHMKALNLLEAREDRKLAKAERKSDLARVIEQDARRSLRLAVEGTRAALNEEGRVFGARITARIAFNAERRRYSRDDNA